MDWGSIPKEDTSSRRASECLCDFPGRSPLASGILQLSGNTPWIITSYAKRFGEDQEKVPSMMMWGA